ncbi:hypothetical protein J7643_03550 [bacterium]|nr:hypothetical protein [bacterium]
MVDRIGNYRNGGPRQQTSYRLRKLFEGLTTEGVTIVLERLRFDPFAVGEAEFSESDLHDKLFRRFLEHLMASYYRKLGWDLINA